MYEIALHETNVRFFEQRLSKCHFHLVMEDEGTGMSLCMSRLLSSLTDIVRVFVLGRFIRYTFGFRRSKSHFCSPAVVFYF